MSESEVLPLVPDEVPPVDRLWREVGDRDDFPAFARSVGLVAQLAEADEKRLDSIATVILRDMSLALRVLRMANSARYRPPGLPEITTVSRALIVLGLRTVKEVALASTVFERLTDHDKQLVEELATVIVAAIVAQQIAERLSLPAEEQIFLSVLFHRLGWLLALRYLPERVARYRALLAAGKRGEEAELSAFEGVRLYEFGQKAARVWQMPQTVTKAMNPPPLNGFSLEEVKGSAGWALSHFVFGAIGRWQRQGGSFAAAMAALADHFPLLGRLRGSDWSTLAERAREEVRLWWQTIAGEEGEQSPLVQAFVREAKEKAAAATERQAIAPPATQTTLAKLVPPPETPVDAARAQSILLVGIEELSLTMLEHQPASSVALLVCELLQRALVCGRVIVFQLAGGGMRPQWGLAPDWDRLKSGWSVTFLPQGDVFQLAIQRNVDIVIDDRDEPSMAAKMPKEIQKLPSARSFLLLPVRTTPTGIARFLLYLDKPVAQQLRLTTDLARLVRLVRNQLAVALRSSPS